MLTMNRVSSNPIGMFGKRLEGNFHIVIGQVAAAKNIEKCIRKGGPEREGNDP